MHIYKCITFFFTCRFQFDFIESGPISHRIPFFIIIFTLNKLTTNLIFDAVCGWFFPIRFNSILHLNDNVFVYMKAGRMVLCYELNIDEEKK